METPEQYTVKSKHWEIIEVVSLHDSYNKETFEGEGPVRGYTARIQGVGRISVDVWGHAATKEQTEAIANHILESLKIYNA